MTDYHQYHPKINVFHCNNTTKYYISLKIILNISRISYTPLVKAILNLLKFRVTKYIYLKQS